MWTPQVNGHEDTEDTEDITTICKSAVSLWRIQYCLFGESRACSVTEPNALLLKPPASPPSLCSSFTINGCCLFNEGERVPLLLRGMGGGWMELVSFPNRVAVARSQQGGCLSGRWVVMVMSLSVNTHIAMCFKDRMRLHIYSLFLIMFNGAWRRHCYTDIL